MKWRPVGRRLFFDTHYGRTPYTSSSVWVPMYTLPFAIIGTENFTPAPAWSLAI